MDLSLYGSWNELNEVFLRGAMFGNCEPLSFIEKQQIIQEDQERKDAPSYRGFFFFWAYLFLNALMYEQKKEKKKKRNAFYEYSRTQEKMQVLDLFIYLFFCM